jgi:OmpA-OmpF porin, OOP family
VNKTQRTIWVSVLGLAAASAVSAQNGSLRWRAAAEPIGLQVTEWRVPCGSVAFPCAASTLVPLYASEVAPRTLSMQVGSSPDGALRLARLPGPNFSLVGKAGIAAELGVYGRIGATASRALPGWAPEAGLTYGVGLSWDFSPRGSASLGWDSYDLRTSGGEGREVRATSLGLQWRY